jgi:hypothetical protein
MSVPSAGIAVELSEAEFVDQLRHVTERYLQTVDAWEEAYARYYRLAGTSRISSDLEPLHVEYLRAKQDLHHCLGRARRLCMKYGIRDPWQSLPHIQLGASSPQSGLATAIGRGERNLIADCLGELTAAVRTPDKTPSDPDAPAPQKSLLKHLFDFLFYKS